MLTPEGFPGQRLLVLPRPLVRRALQRSPTSRLLVTDSGYFPHAASHGRMRERGAREVVVIICAGGLGWCTIDGQTIAVPAGAALVIPPEVPHLYRADAGDPWTIWWAHLTGRDVPALLDPLRGDRLIWIGDLYRATSIITSIVTCMERDETEASLILAAGHGWSLLAQLAADRISGDRSRTEPIRAAQDHLRERFADRITVAELAEIAGLSTSHFAVLFRQATGGGVIEYVKSLRMARARELLATTTSAVQEIAAAVGYSDPFYFSRQFQTTQGLSPSEYRRNFHGEAAP